jgi:hypothetical protein
MLNFHCFPWGYSFPVLCTCPGWEPNDLKDFQKKFLAISGDSKHYWLKLEPQGGSCSLFINVINRRHLVPCSAHKPLGLIHVEGLFCFHWHIYLLPLDKIYFLLGGQWCAGGQQIVCLCYIYKVKDHFIGKTWLLAIYILGHFRRLTIFLAE